MNDSWETDIGGLLAELADVQSALLGVLDEKRQILATSDHEALAAMAGREQQLLDRLQACHERRQQLLARAEPKGCRLIAFARSAISCRPRAAAACKPAFAKRPIARDFCSTRALPTGC